MYREIFTVRVSFKNTFKPTGIEFAFYAVWLFILFKYMHIQSKPVVVRILFIVYPVIYFLRNFLIRICFRITVNTVEQKFTCRRFLHKTEIFFKKDIINFTRKKEYLIIQTATSKITLLCTKYTNFQVLIDYLNS